MHELKIWMNGALVAWKDATVHVAAHALHYGTGIFEGIRAYETKHGSAVYRKLPRIGQVDCGQRELLLVTGNTLLFARVPEETGSGVFGRPCKRRQRALNGARHSWISGNSFERCRALYASSRDVLRSSFDQRLCDGCFAALAGQRQGRLRHAEKIVHRLAAFGVGVRTAAEQ